MCGSRGNDSANRFLYLKENEVTDLMGNKSPCLVSGKNLSCSSVTLCMQFMQNLVVYLYCFTDKFLTFLHTSNLYNKCYLYRREGHLPHCFLELYNSYEL